jgi:DNA-binding transcriptional ArsR family regulator
MSSRYNMELYRLKADISKAFADPKRLMIITELREGERAVGELVKAVGIGQAVISRQLAILRASGVVIPRRAGNNIYYRLADRRICEACDIVHEVLLDRLASNKELAENLLG